MQSESAKELLLADYKYLSDSFWKNEQVGETRVNFYIGLTTAITGGLVALVNAEHGLTGASLRLTLLGAMVSLLIVGVITLLRLLIRNKATDEYKQGLDTIRQTFKDRYDPSGSLVNYYAIKRPADPPVGAKAQRSSALRKFGGLAYMVAGINSIVVSGIVAALDEENRHEGRVNIVLPDAADVVGFTAKSIG